MRESRARWSVSCAEAQRSTTECRPLCEKSASLARQAQAYHRDAFRAQSPLTNPSLPANDAQGYRYQ